VVTDHLQPSVFEGFRPSPVNGTCSVSFGQEKEQQEECQTDLYCPEGETNANYLDNLPLRSQLSAVKARLVDWKLRKQACLIEEGSVLRQKLSDRAGAALGEIVVDRNQQRST
jgi:hypothetical protein